MCPRFIFRGCDAAGGLFRQVIFLTLTVKIRVRLVKDETGCRVFVRVFVRVCFKPVCIISIFVNSDLRLLRLVLREPEQKKNRRGKGREQRQAYLPCV